MIPFILNTSQQIVDSFEGSSRNKYKEERLVGKFLSNLVGLSNVKVSIFLSKHASSNSLDDDGNNNNNNNNTSRKEGGRGLASIEDSIDTSIHRLENYIQIHEGGLITATRHETENTMNNRMTITRKQKWEGKQLYGRFKRLINNISHDKT